MFPTKFVPIIAAAFLVCAGSGARAQTIAAQPVPASVSPAAAAGHAAFAGSAISDADLGQVAGREDTGAMIAAADQRNVVANNSVSGNSVTGDVVIDGNAFQNVQGLAVISANTGNNVAINSAMNVTINMGQ